MAIKKDKKTETKKEAQELNIKVTRAHDFSKDDNTSISFDMVVNGITIYGCWYREGKKQDGSDYSMVAFPSRKDEKTGKYYNHAYVKLSDDQVDEIATQIENLI
jgi:hypothetical protein